MQLLRVLENVAFQGLHLPYVRPHEADFGEENEFSQQRHDLLKYAERGDVEAQEAPRAVQLVQAVRELLHLGEPAAELLHADRPEQGLKVASLIAPAGQLVGVELLRRAEVEQNVGVLVVLRRAVPPAYRPVARQPREHDALVEPVQLLLVHLRQQMHQEQMLVLVAQLLQLRDPDNRDRVLNQVFIRPRFQSPPVVEGPEHLDKVGDDFGDPDLVFLNNTESVANAPLYLLKGLQIILINCNAILHTQSLEVAHVIGPSRFCKEGLKLRVVERPHRFVEDQSKLRQAITYVVDKILLSWLLLNAGSRNTHVNIEIRCRRIVRVNRDKRHIGKIVHLCRKVLLLFSVQFPQKCLENVGSIFLTWSSTCQITYWNIKVISAFFGTLFIKAERFSFYMAIVASCYFFVT